MTSGILPPPYRHTALTEATCLELLASKAWGRLAFQHEGPVVLPLNYVVAEGLIIVRTSPYGHLARHLSAGGAGVTAFQVDQFDERSGVGWSVLVRGPAAPLGGHEVSALEQRPKPWVGGLQSLYLGIKPRSVSGRCYGPSSLSA